MRRYVSYLIMCGALLLGVGAATTPTILAMNPDISYAQGQTMYFKAAEWSDTSLNGNLTDDDGEYLQYRADVSKQPIEYIADTMRGRLDPALRSER